MEPVDVGALGAVPAPVWFVVLFKTLGYVLHSVPMQLWLVGLPMALFLLLIGGPNAKACSRRFFVQLPIIMALGINLGIVPLLFIQTAYGRAFYPTTILTAWHWFGIIPLVLIAYYLIYATAGWSKRGYKWRPILTGLAAALLLAAVGLIFAATWTLLAAPDDWPRLWAEKSTAGAATGLGTAWSNPVLYLRFAQVVGLGFLTFSCWILIDAYFFYRAAPGVPEAKKPVPPKPEPKLVFANQTAAKPQYKDFHENPNLSRKEKKRLQRLRDRGELSIEDELAALETGPAGGGDKGAAKAKASRIESTTDDAYRRWALRFVSCVQWFGICLAGGFLWFYYYKTLSPETPNLAFLFDTNAKFLPVAVLGSLGLFALMALLGAFGVVRSKRLAAALGFCDLLTLALYAVTRQMIQNAQIKETLDVWSLPTRVEWSPLILFLVLFVLGMGVVFWLLRTAAKYA